MDNRIFNINGRGKEMLLATLDLAFNQCGRKMAARAYIIDPKKGMVLLWHADKGSQSFPVPLSANAATEMVWEWLQSNPDIECKDWDEDFDHNGHNTEGWRVFCENWGHVSLAPSYSASDATRYAIVAIKPAYMWMGK
jgi:hypothetical protein